MLSNKIAINKSGANYVVEKEMNLSYVSVIRNGRRKKKTGLLLTFLLKCQFFFFSESVSRLVKEELNNFKTI